jgi:TonB family protein
MKSKLLFAASPLCHTFGWPQTRHPARDAGRFAEEEIMKSYRLRLYASILVAGLLCSNFVGAAPRVSQDGNSNNNATVKPARKKAKRRRVRAQRDRTSQANAVESVPQVTTPAKTPNNALKLPPGIDIDPMLYPPDQRKGGRDAGGIGTGAGGGGGMGVGAGGVVDYNRTFSARDVDRKARIIYKPEPLMTEAARRNNTVGTVVLRVTLEKSGEVTNIRVTSGLPDGLSEKAVEAARKIKFQPAVKDGRAVSQHLQIEYNFNNY